MKNILVRPREKWCLVGAALQNAAKCSLGEARPGVRIKHLAELLLGGYQKLIGKLQPITSRINLPVELRFRLLRASRTTWEDGCVGATRNQPLV